MNAICPNCNAVNPDTIQINADTSEPHYTGEPGIHCSACNVTSAVSDWERVSKTREDEPTMLEVIDSALQSLEDISVVIPDSVLLDMRILARRLRVDKCIKSTQKLTEKL